MLNLHEPGTYKEVSSDSYWQQDIKEELQAFGKNSYLGLS